MGRNIIDTKKTSKNIIRTEDTSFKINNKDNDLTLISSSINLSIHEDIFKKSPQKPTLLSTKDNIFVYSVDIYQNYPVIKKLRAFIKHIYGKSGYVGFSDLCDLQYDYYSKWFYAENEKGEIQSTMRLVLKDKNNLLPIEMGIVDTEPKYRYVIDTKNKVADINSFCFKRLNTIELLNSTIASFCIENKINTLYCMCDVLSSSINKLYRRIGCLESKTLIYPIYFPGYGKVINGELTPTKWNIMEIPLTQLKKIAAKASQ